MQRADSPSSYRSQDRPARVSQTSTSSSNKAAYRLFPSVEPTPPASPVSLQRAALTKVTESSRRRSSSLDETSRARYHAAPRHSLLLARRGRMASASDLQPMVTVQEQETAADSPTVPSRFTFRSVTTTVSDDSWHGRSSSAPSEYVRDSQIYPPFAPRQESANEMKPPQPVWVNRQAAASTQTLHGLGLTLPAPLPAKSTSVRRGARQKPNLRLNIKSSRDKELPPPPPPKSPRHHSRNASIHSQNASLHSRTSSVQSRMSSRASSPIAVAQSMACTSVKPTFVDHSAPVRTPPTAPEARTVYMTKSVDAQAQSGRSSPAMDRGRARQVLMRKPVPRLPMDTTPDQASSLITPPASRFSIEKPMVEETAEGEVTPKAIPPAPQKYDVPLPDSRTVPDLEPEPAISTDALTGPSVERDERPPPTPLKDVFHLKKRSDDIGERPATPLKDHQDEALRPALASPRPSQTSKLGPPSRAPPLPPGSSQPVHGPEPAPSSIVASPELPTQTNVPEPTSKPVERPIDKVLAPTPGSKTSSPELPGQTTASEPTSKPVRRPIDKGPTPDLPLRAGTPDLMAKADPFEVLKDLAKQTDALHARYASLRSERQKLSTSIVSSLKEQKAGPEYVNTLLDRHLALAAINSSMDICFAKLKSLECRKEEAMGAAIAQAAKRRADKSKQPASMKSASSLRETGTSGRSTPELSVEVIKTSRSPSKLRKDSAQEVIAIVAAEGDKPRKDSPTTTAVEEKRNTMIKSPPPVPSSITAEPEEVGSTTDVEEDQHPRKLRIKGAKAAKILGLMKEAAGHRPGSPGITLPDDVDQRIRLSPQLPQHAHSGQSIELHIRSTSPFRLLPPPSPAPRTPLPTPPPGSKDTDGSSAGSRSEAPSRAGSNADSSSPDEPEAMTPKEERDAAMDALKSPKGLTHGGGIVPAVQVFVQEEEDDLLDEDILDFYGYDIKG